MKKVFKLSLIILTLFLSFNLKVKAATGYINVKNNSNTVIVGRTFTTSVTISSSVALGSWEFSLNYNSSLLKLESGSVYVADYGNGSIKSKTYTYTFKALASGTTTVGVKSYAGYDWSESKLSLTAGSSSVKLLTQQQLEATYSKNNNLSSLSVDGQTLTPTFSKDTLNYTLELNPNTESIVINAKLEDSRSRVDGTGSKTVTEGENKFEIIVTAQNGSIKKYVLNAIVKDPNPIEVTTVNNEKMTIVKRESLLTAPVDFIKNTVNINDVLVPSLYNQENQLVLVGLKDKNSNINLYIYDSISKKYSPYIELKFDNNRILPIELKNDSKRFNNYIIDKSKINNIEFNTYKLDKKSDYSIFYGLNIENGNKEYYKFDSKINSIIRFENEEATLINNKLIKSEKLKNIFMYISFVSLPLLITSIIAIIAIKKNKTKASVEEITENKEIEISLEKKVKKKGKK